VKRVGAAHAGLFTWETMMANLPLLAYGWGDNSVTIYHGGGRVLTPYFQSYNTTQHWSERIRAAETQEELLAVVKSYLGAAFAERPPPGSRFAGPI
jgi:hypothetical protein